jgi:hypothetical protein
MWLLSEERVQKQGRHTLCPRLCHPHFEGQCLCDLHVSKAQKTNKFTRVQKSCEYECAVFCCIDNQDSRTDHNILRLF